MSRALSIVGIVLLVAVASGAYFLFQGDAADTAQQQVQGPDLDGRQGPEQPIEFWHSVHAGQNQISCMYCHYTADRSKSAGIPSVKLCVGCHIAGGTAIPPDQVQQLTFPVEGGGGPERPDWWYAEANELLDYWREQKPIPWVKIHDLPEHAHFPHYSHVNVGLQCQTCHGQVQEMERVYQASSLLMGWCIDCHEGETELSPEEEATIRQRSSYVREIRALAAAGQDVSGATGLWPKQRASIDCTVCHY